MSKNGFDQKAFDNLNASIQADIDTGRIFGASIIVARNGKIGLRKTFGTVTPEGRPAADDDLYLTMSVSKSFTAALVLRAIDEGRFTLDTKVAEIIPEMAAAGKGAITIRQCLNHTAGLFPGHMFPGLNATDAVNLEKTVKAIAPLPVAYVAGTRCAYAPISGYAVLGRILEVTDPKQRSFSEITRQDLFEPLGMKDTIYGLDGNNPHRVPISHTPRESTPQTQASEQILSIIVGDGSGCPAAGAWSTVDDTFRFAETMRLRGNNGHYRLLSESLFDYACKIHTGDLSNDTLAFERIERGVPDFPANFSLLGGYVRGEGHFLTAGTTASPDAFFAIGGGSTMWFVDPKRDFTFVFYSAGLLTGLAHLQRLSRLADLALAACD